MSFTGRAVLVSILTIVASAISSPRAALSAVSFTGDVTFGSTMTVGTSSFGSFRIDAGSTYTNSSFGTVNVGSQQGSLGLATVTDPGSQWLWGSSGSTAL